jgi:hypothetical protein
MRFPGYGDAHGFAVAVDAGKGTHRVCVEAVNVGGGTTSTLSCQSLVVK